jgi:uncharacterized repeat protein (TIGR03803 family)
VLHAFNGADGFLPAGGLLFDAAGNLYGSTQHGGGGTPFDSGYGVIFELRPGVRGRRLFSVIHFFTGSTASAGILPVGTMAIDMSGNLYGTTFNGGNLNHKCIFGYNYGCGVVFELASGSHHAWKYSLLHSFNGKPDGVLPTGVVMSADGKLYGTTIGGGAMGLGSVFEVTP